MRVAQIFIVLAFFSLGTEAQAVMSNSAYTLTTHMLGGSVSLLSSSQYSLTPLTVGVSNHDSTSSGVKQGSKSSPPEEEGASAPPDVPLANAVRTESLPSHEVAPTQTTEGKVVLAEPAGEDALPPDLRIVNPPREDVSPVVALTASALDGANDSLLEYAGMLAIICGVILLLWAARPLIFLLRE